MKLENKKYYWVKSDKKSGWEIAQFVKNVVWNKEEDTFFFTNNSYLYVKDCLEIDDKPIERK